MEIFLNKQKIHLTKDDLADLDLDVTLWKGRRFSYPNPLGNGFYQISFNELLRAALEAAKPEKNKQEVKDFFAALVKMKERGYSEPNGKIRNANFLVRIITKIKHYFATKERKKLFSEFSKIINKLDKWDDRDFVLNAVKKDGNLIKKAHKKFLDDKEIALAVVRQRGNNVLLKDFSPRIQDDEEVVLEALNGIWSVLQYASPRLRDKKEIVLKHVQKGADFNDASPRLKDDKDIVLEAVKRAGIRIKYAGDKMKDDEDVILASLQFTHAMIHASPRLRNDRNFNLAAAKRSGLSLMGMKNDFQDDFEIVLEAVKNNKKALEYASKRLQNHPEILAAAGENLQPLLQPKVPVKPGKDKDANVEIINHQKNHFGMLPKEIKANIFSYLKQGKDFVNLSEVDKDSRKSILNFLSAGKNPPILALDDFTDDMLKLFPKNFSDVEEIHEVNDIKDLIHNFPNAKNIKLVGNEITDHTLKSIAQHCSKLQKLHLEDCKNISSGGLKVLLDKCEQLEELHLIRTNIDYLELMNFDKSLPSLKILKCYMNNFYQKERDVNLKTFETIIKKCPNLQEIDFEDHLMGGSEILKLIGIHCPFIRKINIGLLYGFDDINCRSNEDDFIHLIKNCKQIQEFNVRSPLTLSDRFFISLAENCNNLKRLSVGSKISDEGLMALANHCKDLQELSVSNIIEFYKDIPSQDDGIVTQDGLDKLLKSCQNLKQICLITNKEIPPHFFNCLKNYDNLAFVAIITKNCRAHFVNDERNDKHLRIKLI